MNSNGETGSVTSRLMPHALRQTAASLVISAGANVKAVQKMLGDASAALTLDVYADLFDDDLDAVGEAVSKAGEAAAAQPRLEAPMQARVSDLGG